MRNLTKRQNEFLTRRALSISTMLTHYKSLCEVALPPRNRRRESWRWAPWADVNAVASGVGEGDAIADVSIYSDVVQVCSVVMPFGCLRLLIIVSDLFLRLAPTS